MLSTHGFRLKAILPLSQHYHHPRPSSSLRIPSTNPSILCVMTRRNGRPYIAYFRWEGGALFRPSLLTLSLGKKPSGSVGWVVSGAWHWADLARWNETSRDVNNHRPHIDQIWWGSGSRCIMLFCSIQRAWNGQLINAKWLLAGNCFCGCSVHILME